MKKNIIYYFLISLLFCSVTYAQKVKLGPVSENAAGELLTTDAVNKIKSTFYKSMSFSIKAGSGIVFVMKSAAFTPRIVMTDKAGKTIGTYHNPEKGKSQEATVALNAFSMSNYPKIFPADTTFAIYFTSAEQNATGKYNFGYIMLDSSQMVYDENGPICNRLIYLINQWQAGWSVIPALKRDRQPHNSYYTECGLMPKKPKDLAVNTAVVGRFKEGLLDKTKSYEEIIFESITDNGSAVYDKVIGEIKQCLGDKDWVFKTEVTEDKELGNKIFISSFQIKGASTNQERTVLSISRVVPKYVSGLTQYKVLVHFN